MRNIRYILRLLKGFIKHRSIINLVLLIDDEDRWIIEKNFDYYRLKPLIDEDNGNHKLKVIYDIGKDKNK